MTLVLWQIRYEQRAFWRDRRRAILSFMFPLMMLLLFGSLNQNSTVDNGGGSIPFLTFFVPGIVAYGVGDSSVNYVPEWWQGATREQFAAVTQIALPARPAKNAHHGRGVPLMRLSRPCSRAAARLTARFENVVVTTP